MSDAAQLARKRRQPHRLDDLTAMYPNNDTLDERLRLYVEENFHIA